MEQRDINVSFGKNITSASDTLQTITVEQLYKKISEPESQLQSHVNQLRTLQNIDDKQYRKQKVNLPYVTCGRFNPPYRRMKNFSAIDCFILDIDHITSHERNLHTVREKLAMDDRVMLLFTSPGNDGLKLLFRLSETVYDAGKFSMFYKLFVKHFAGHYDVQDIMDTKTSDVTRACFLSVDAEAYFNPQALPVDMKAIINFESSDEVAHAQKLFKEEQQQEKAEEKNQEKEGLPEEVILNVRKKLNPNARSLKEQKQKQIYVPEKLNQIVEDVQKLMEDNQIELREIININYGKKFQFGVKHVWAEINVFHGKRGFTVVKSPKKGSNTELMDVCHDLVSDMLLNYKHENNQEPPF